MKIFSTLCLMAFLFLISFISNGDNKDNNKDPIVIKGSYVFELKPDRGFQSSFAYIDEENNEYLRSFYINQTGKSFIEIYDLKSGKQKEDIFLENTNEIGTFFRNADKSFWVFNYHGRKLQRHAADGKILFHSRDIGKLKDFGGPYTSYYGESDFNPLNYFEGKIYHMSSMLTRSGVENDLKELDDAGLIIEYDVDQDKYSWRGRFPEILKKFDYSYLNRFSTTRNNNYLIVAPYFSNELTIFNLETGQQSVARNTVMQKDKYYIPKHFSVLKSNPVSNKENNSGTVHYKSNSHYIGILYDSYKKLYYRVLLTPKQGSKPSSLALYVLDEKFNLISVYNLPIGYHYKGMFVSKEGLNILNLSEYNKNSDYLVFDTFKF
jgi:hypothetical protein